MIERIICCKSGPRLVRTEIKREEAEARRQERAEAIVTCN